jgi:hypothetical protein
MSPLPPKVDIDERDQYVRFVPKADITVIANPANFFLREGDFFSRRAVGRDHPAPPHLLPQSSRYR